MSDVKPPPAPTQPPVGPAGGKTNTLAIVSLVLAFFVSLGAVITGHLALSQIKKTNEEGRGLALIGLTLGYLGLAAGAVALIIFLTLPLIVSQQIAGLGSQDDFSSGGSPGAEGAEIDASLEDGLNTAVVAYVSALVSDPSATQIDAESYGWPVGGFTLVTAGEQFCIEAVGADSSIWHRDSIAFDPQPGPCP